MHCQYCGSINGEDDHRCLRCGRRIAGIVVAAPTSYIGATALAVSPQAFAKSQTETNPRAQAEQPPLFFAPDQKVIPFEQVQRQVAGRNAAAQPASAWNLEPPVAPAPKPPSAPRASAKRQSTPPGQGNLDFRPGSPQGERILETGVVAQVAGEGRVAPPVRRLTAGAMDASMVLLGFGVFAATVRFGGTAFGVGKAVWITLGLSFVLISMFYGLVWAIARRETAGMNWTQLRLVTFDGGSLDGRNRTVRFLAAWLSYCSGGLGLLWTLADEESLSFHDHISKTYPAEKEYAGRVVRQRR